MSASSPSPKEPFVLSSVGPAARIVPSTGAELILSVLHLSDLAPKRFGEHARWQELLGRVEPATARTLSRLGQHPTINMLGLAFDTAEPMTGQQLLDHLGKLPPAEIVLTAVGGYRRTMRRQTNGDVIRAAVEGDRAARREFRRTTLDLPEWQRSIEYLLGRPPAEMAAALIDALGRWYEAGFAEEESRIATEQAAAAEALRELRSAWTVDALMAHVLPGVDYVPPAFVNEVTFVPDVVVRPGLVFLDHRMGSIATFPIQRSDEDADEPPDVLVRLGKALGDEFRLRALRILARGPISLGDLAAELGVPRSTLSHHVGVLRSAGLVTMGIDDGRWGKLRLRADGIDSAPDVFRRYITAEQPR